MISDFRFPIYAVLNQTMRLVSGSVRSFIASRFIIDRVMLISTARKS
jgi:hypothetical protein